MSIESLAEITQQAELRIKEIDKATAALNEVEDLFEDYGFEALEVVEQFLQKKREYFRRIVKHGV